MATVAGLLGHSQPSTTLDIYTHAFDMNKQAASRVLQEGLEIQRRWGLQPIVSGHLLLTLPFYRPLDWLAIRGRTGHMQTQRILQKPAVILHLMPL